MVGPVEVQVMTFPESRVPHAVVDALVELVDHGVITVLDLILLADEDGLGPRVVEMDQDVERFGLGRLAVRGDALVSAEDLELVRTGLPKGASALITVYEQSWAGRLGAQVAGAGGEIALHVRIPANDVAAAYSAAS